VSDAGRAERNYYTPKDAPVTDMLTEECPRCEGEKCDWCDFEGVIPIFECELCDCLPCQCDVRTEWEMDK
jgi:hypothetical protein